MKNNLIFFILTTNNPNKIKLSEISNYCNYQYIPKKKSFKLSSLINFMFVRE